ncbi:uncharacterized protein LOC110893512 [Helianthus annuus]|uniref:uncharacterized protein LOC110893512 n=1 Tax=Helianthus annuus TaxID=4232 RepID=UPI000B8EFDF5|nr:uncharacterized protein LOC110893512 [Helianthus annuus]
MGDVSSKWQEIVEWLLARARSKSARNYIAKILVAAAVYFIWQERNARTFMNQLRPPEKLSEIILNTVRYKLMGAKLRDTSNVRRLLEDFTLVQVDRNPLDGQLRLLEAQCLKEFQEAAYDEECFLKQKSKVEWLCAGDSNTKFFHNTVKSKNARVKIYSVVDSMGTRHEGEAVADAMVLHYSNFLGFESQVESANLDNLFSNVLCNDVAEHMVRPITREEVKSAMFSIGDDKAPGPDGYTSVFFQKAWDIVGNERTTPMASLWRFWRLNL